MSITALETAPARIPVPTVGPTFSPHRMRTARQRGGVDFDALAAALGRNERTVRRYETGQIVPPADVIGALSVVLSVPIADLFE